MYLSVCDHMCVATATHLSLCFHIVVLSYKILGGHYCMFVLLALYTLSVKDCAPAPLPLQVVLEPTCLVIILFRAESAGRAPSQHLTGRVISLLEDHCQEHTCTPEDFP